MEVNTLVQGMVVTIELGNWAPYFVFLSTRSSGGSKKFPSQRGVQGLRGGGLGDT